MRKLAKHTTASRLPHSESREFRDEDDIAGWLPAPLRRRDPGEVDASGRSVSRLRGRPRGPLADGPEPRAARSDPNIRSRARLRLGDFGDMQLVCFVWSSSSRSWAGLADIASRLEGGQEGPDLRSRSFRRHRSRRIARVPTGAVGVSLPTIGRLGGAHVAVHTCPPSGTQHSPEAAARESPSPRPLRCALVSNTLRALSAHMDGRLGSSRGLSARVVCAT